jgi:repressor LexA
VETFAERLQQALQFRNIKPSELATKTGFSQSLISQYLSGKFEAKNDKISSIATALNVSESWLAGFSSDIEIKEINKLIIPVRAMTNKIPVYGRIPAGVPFEAIQDMLEDVEIPSWLAEKKDLFGLKVIGDSMNKVVPDGAIAVLQKTEHLNNGEIGAILVNGFDATLKKFYKLTDSIVLEPLSYNPSYEPMVIKENGQDVKAIGRLVWFCAAEAM